MNLKDSNQFDLLDLIALLSFFVGVENLDLNVTQEDAQRLEHELNNKANLILTEIHEHLERQDKKIEQILEVLKHDGR